MSIVLDGTAGITTPEIVSTGGPLVVNASAPDNSVVVNASGNVGIGTSSPDGRLHVMTSSAGSVTADADADDLTVEGAANPGISILGTGDDVCSVYFGNPGSNGQKDGGIRYFQESFATVADRRSMTFITGTLERARIDSSGNLLVGTTTSEGRITIRGDGCGSFIGSITNANSFSCNPAHGLIFRAGFNGNASGSQFFSFRRPDNNVLGTITQNGASTVAYNTSSDYRLKHDITPMTGALAKVAALKPVTYKWNEGNSNGEGFIAHELAEICPDAVSGEKDEVDAEGNPQYQGIDTSFLVATLTAAIQELKAINDAQAQTIESLTARVVALEQA